MLLSGENVFPEGDPMSTYHYTGTKQWSDEEKRQFTKASRTRKKNFWKIAKAVSILYHD